VKNGKILILLSFFFTACANQNISVNPQPNKTLMYGLNISGFKKEIKNWDLYCDIAELNEKDKIIICKNSNITVFKNGLKSAKITGNYGFVNLNDKKSFIQDNVKVHSYTQDTDLYSNKLYFDSNKELIWSDEKVTVINKEIETKAMGFEAKPDLSIIKFFSHETKKI